MPRQMNVVELSVSSQLKDITPWPPAVSGLAGGYEAEPGGGAVSLEAGVRRSGMMLSQSEYEIPNIRILF